MVRAMTKNKRKVVLRKETVRQLTGLELNRAVGGLDTGEVTCPTGKMFDTGEVMCTTTRR